MPKTNFLYLFYSLRPTNWIKNLFMFLPLIFGKRLFVFPYNLRTVAAFCLFSLAASVVYLINDVIDIEKDKFHPIKRLRPIASGRVGVKPAKITALILSVFSVVLSFKLNVYFGYMVVLYLMFNVLYSKILKEIVIIDVFCLGGFFLLRIISGSVVAGVRLSHWIIIMSVLLALFLGFAKRRQELGLHERGAAHHRSVLIKYDPYFIDQMIAIITSSIVIAYMLYTVDNRTVMEFGSKHLMFSIPFVYYGIFRYLYIIHKVKHSGDPTRILLSDKILQVDIALWITVCIAVVYSIL